MSAADDAKIKILENGPYLVSGDVPLALQTIVPKAEGGSWEWREGKAFEGGAKYALCRCGHSSNKPFCDGTHAKVGFDGTETADRAPYAQQAVTIQGPLMELDDVEHLCAFGRFCDNYGGIWSIAQDGDSREGVTIAKHEAGHCPSGRLVIRDRATDENYEPKLERSIGITEDPEKDCSGPLWIRGGIPIASADGTPYETRNRVTLCRCGQSTNKPFCDGSHARGFKDGIAE